MKIKFEIADAIVKNNYFKERSLSEHACKSMQGIRLLPAKEVVSDRINIRPIFSHDTDRIIHSLAYSRYIDKTQVFYLIENDHVSHRVLHVQLVAKIARTIARFLNLNEDLVEAISLGHDVGHTPFGHNGEKIISQYCKENGVGCFVHNAQSFRLFHEIEKSGQGLNLSVQVLDGIICHNGEMLSQNYKNDKRKTPEKLLVEYKSCFDDEQFSRSIIPMTLEGCVMRISDVIAYIGRDIEDAIKVKLINKDDLPKDIAEIIGCTNAELINNLIIDIVNNSFGKDSISFSPNVFNALKKLMAWNYEHIYNNPKKMVQDDKIKRMFIEILNMNYESLMKEKEDEYITRWVNDSMNESYKINTNPHRIVADFVSGMTDDFIIKSYETRMIPKSFGLHF